jgi:DNA-directed RNA polymerase specialized sigma24 family protein
MPAEAILPPKVVTNALRAVAARLPGAVDEVWTLVYPWVVQRAKVLLRGDSLRGEVGEPNDLAHEAFLKLKPAHLAACRDRMHLIRIATRAMRQALVDRARHRRVAVVMVPLEDAPLGALRSAVDLDEPLDVALALDELETVNPKVAEVATLHLIGGLCFVEIGRVLGRSEAWARMVWGQAEGWLESRFGL